MIGRNPPVESVPEQLTAPSQRETLQHLQEETEYFYCSHAQPVSHKGLTAGAHCHLISIRHASIPTLRRTFRATLTISCVRVRDFPIQLAAFFVESLQHLPHFVRPTATTQLQVLPVELQGGAGVLDAVVGFPLNVQVWKQTGKKGQQG